MTRTDLRTYTPEFRAEAVKVVLEQGLSLEAAAQQLSVPKGTLANWVKAAKRGSTATASPPGSRSVAELEEENARLRRELAVERMEKEVPKKGHGVLCSGVAARYAQLKTMRPDYPISLLCRVFEVSRSGFYAWLNRKPSSRRQADERLKVAIRAAHRQSRETYGVRRMQPKLEAQGFAAGRDWIGRLRHELGLICKQKRKFKATTNSRHDLPVAPNLLEQRFEPTALNQQWLVDITCVPTEEGWLYLGGVKGVFTCEIVGYAMDERMTQGLTAKALWHAIRNKRPPVGLIQYSDRGCQYCAHDYRKLLDQFGIRASMSRKGNCYDNAPMKSFWSSLKNELTHHQRYKTRANAKAAIQEYIEIFYDRQRQHSRLGYQAPAVFAETSKYMQAA